MANPYIDIAGVKDGEEENDNPYLKIAGVKPAEASASDIGMGILKGINKGAVGLITAPYRLLDWGIEKVTGGEGLPEAAEMPIYKPYLDPDPAESDAGRYAMSAGEAVGGSVLPALGLISKGQKLAAAGQSAVQASNAATGAVRHMAEQAASAPGKFAAADLVASTGAGLARQAAEDEDAGPIGEIIASIAGAVAPTTAIGTVQRTAKAMHPVISPTLARWNADLEAFRHKHGILASADGGLPVNPGAEAQAEQIIANQLHRAGRSVDDLRSSLDEAAEAGRYHSSGRAQDALAPVDLDPSLQRLAGSAARASPEAGNTAQTFVTARQTGVTPAGDAQPSGIPTKPLLSEPMTGAQAERQLGSRFGTPDDKIVPMGQGERIQDALKRALRIEDNAHHGHASNAYRTDQQILEAARSESKKLYGDAYSAGGNVDIRPKLQPVMQKWADAITDEPLPVQREIRKALQLFTSGQGNVVNNVERFDKAKQYLDGVIEKLFQSAEGRNRYLGGVLTKMKNEMIAAVDSINTNGLGQKYSAARGAYGSRMEAREALQLGRDVFKANSDIGVDAFRAMQTPGQQKLFKLGLLRGYEEAAEAMPRQADKTRIFDNPRIQQILAEAIERSSKQSAEFADRPERFGRYVGNEKRMIQTRDEVLGNSKTAQRLKDDEAFQDMNALNSAIEKFRQSGSVINVGIRAAEHLINKLFGMRADVAAELARQLFTADPLRRAMILSRIERRMGRDRFSHFSRLMQQAQAASAPAAVSGVAASQDPTQ